MGCPSDQEKHAWRQKIWSCTPKVSLLLVCYHQIACRYDLFLSYWYPEPPFRHTAKKHPALSKIQKGRRKLRKRKTKQNTGPEHGNSWNLDAKGVLISMKSSQQLSLAHWLVKLARLFSLPEDTYALSVEAGMPVMNSAKKKTWQAITVYSGKLRSRAIACLPNCKWVWGRSTGWRRSK